MKYRHRPDFLSRFLRFYLQSGQITWGYMAFLSVRPSTPRLARRPRGGWCAAETEAQALVAQCPGGLAASTGGGPRRAACQRCGSNSSRPVAGCVGRRASTSRR